MRIIIASLLVLAIVSTAFPAPTLADGPVRIMPFGDSTTMGQTWVDGVDSIDTPELTAQWIAGWTGYRQPLKEALAADGYSVDFVGSQSNGCQAFADCQHEGHGGYSILALNGIVGPAISAQHPDVVLVMVGTAGLHVGLDTATNAGANLTTLLETIYASDPTVAVVLAMIPPLGLPPGDALYADFNAAMPGVVAARQAAGQRIVLVDPGLTLTDLVDGIHPTPSGYQKIADAFESGIEHLSLSVCNPRPGVSVATTPIGPGRLHVVTRIRGRGNSMTGFGFTVLDGATITNSTWDSAAGVAVGATFDIVAVDNGPVHVAWTLTDQCGATPGTLSYGGNAF
jgi:hypothetical protein